MLEEVIRVEVERLLGSVGLEFYHPPDVMRTLRSRPDIYSMNPSGLSFVIEVKRIESKTLIEDWMDLEIISNPQRRWLDRWAYRGGMGFLALGTTTVGARRLWIIPWLEWAAFEQRKTHGPLASSRVEVSEIEAEFSQYECKWITGKGKAPWQFPETHPIMTNPLIVHKQFGENDWDKVRGPRFSIRFEEPEKKPKVKKEKKEKNTK